MRLIPTLIFLAGALASAQLSAQAPDPEGRRALPDTFQFGPPLRSKLLFAYKYTERVTSTIEIDGMPFDSSQRYLTYYLTMRQIVSDDGSGRVAVEVNTDSMQLEVRNSGDSLVFHTQHLHGTDWDKVKHREVLVPSALVNRMVTFDLSSYGELLNVVSKALDDVRDQGTVPGVDEFTRVRIDEVTAGPYVASVLLPWRCVVPLGSRVPVGKPVAVRRVPLTMDRVVFRNDVTSQVDFGSDGLPLLRFTATLDSAITHRMTLVQFAEPITVTSARGSLTGQLKLEEDGVAASGWSVTKGVIEADRGGQKVVERVTHEVYIEPMGTISYAG